MKLQYRLIQDDFLTQQLFAVSLNPRARKRRLRNWLIIPSLFLLTAFLLRVPQDETISVSFFIAAGTWLVFYPFYYRWLYRRHYTKHVQDKMANRTDRLFSLGLDNQRLELSDDVSESRIALSELDALYDLGDRAILVFKGGLSLLIPKNRVEEGDPETLLKELETAVGKERIDKTGWRWR